VYVRPHTIYLSWCRLRQITVTLACLKQHTARVSNSQSDDINIMVWSISQQHCRTSRSALVADWRVRNQTQYFDTVGWVLQPVKNRRPYNLYCVGGDVKPCSINQSIIIKQKNNQFKVYSHMMQAKHDLCKAIVNWYFLFGHDYSASVRSFVVLPSVL